MKAKYLFFTLLFAASLGLDQLSKVWARSALKPKGFDGTVTVIKGFFDLRYSENTGSAFGMFRNTPGARYILFAVGIICLGVVAAWLYKLPSRAPWMGAKLGLLAGGAVGNIVDRVSFGRVTDFILWKVTIGGHLYEWPIFNVADAALVIGVAMLLLDWPKDRALVEEPASGAPAESTA